MSKVYSTSSYLNDSGSLIGYVVNIVERVIRICKRFVVKLLNSDIEARTVEILIQIPAFLFIIFLGFFIALALVNQTESEKGYRFVSILTTSMAPAIRPGSIVFLGPPQNVREGDIVSFNEMSALSGKLTGRRVAHRIIEVKTDAGKEVYITKGDANSLPDPSYTTDPEILGKVLLVIPLLGYLSFFSLTSWGIFTLLLIPAGVLIYSEIRVVKKYFSTR